jgi:hypothetical protein
VIIDEMRGFRALFNKTIRLTNMRLTPLEAELQNVFLRPEEVT